MGGSEDAHMMETNANVAVNQNWQIVEQWSKLKWSNETNCGAMKQSECRRCRLDWAITDVVNGFQPGSHWLWFNFCAIVQNSQILMSLIIGDLLVSGDPSIGHSAGDNQGGFYFGSNSEKIYLSKQHNWEYLIFVTNTTCNLFCPATGPATVKKSVISTHIVSFLRISLERFLTKWGNFPPANLCTLECKFFQKNEVIPQRYEYILHEIRIDKEIETAGQQIILSHRGLTKATMRGRWRFKF